MVMDKIVVFWVDARLGKFPSFDYRDLSHFCRLYVADKIEAVPSLMESARPGLIVFDFDYPDLTGLQALQRIRQRFSAIPVLMLTAQHYENLAVWALRSRVWDYLVKPVTRDVFMERLHLLEAVIRDRCGERLRRNLMPLPPIPMEARFSGTGKSGRSTRSAVAYVESHLHEKIPEETVAKLCDMGRFEFSRIFRHEHGITFRDYLLNTRLVRAAAMLRQTRAAVTDVAFSVGFRDLSHFARLFRRNIGCTPSKYRQLHRPD